MRIPKVPLDDLFEEWELRVCILLSLFLQIFLIVAGTLRRLAAHQWIVILLWLAYLLAEIIAVFGLGLIVSNQSLFSKYCDNGEPDTCYDDHLHIYWAPFLLVHIGGPDTITAFAPEDNELWPRHLFYLASQCIVVAYSLSESLQSNHQLRIPTVIMFLCGFVKCLERTAALYYGSANCFLNSMLSKSDLDASITKKEARFQIRENENALSHLQVLQYAFIYFTAFKGLVVDLDISVNERNQSREFFLATSCKEAFWLVEVELNYLYDVLYSKLPLLHHKLGYCCRAIYFIAVVASLGLFHYVVNREKYTHLDVVITYILLMGGVGLEVIAFFTLIFCDWTVVKLKPLSSGDNLNNKSWKDKFVDWILFVNSSKSVFLNWLLHFVGDKDHHPEAKFTDCRWADSLSKFNLILYCLHRPSKGTEYFYSYFGLVSFVKWIWYVRPQPLSHNIAGFIFNELKMKSEKAGSLSMAKEICLSKGEWVLHENEHLGNFLRFVENYNYDDILLLWHIATELCYNDRQDQETDNQRDTAKQLSDYMLYLMVMKPDMMSAVSGIGQMKFQNICTEVNKLLDTGESLRLKNRNFCLYSRQSQEKEDLLTKACERILSFDRVSETVTGKRDRDILFTASVLAKELKVLPSEKKWLIISKLWVELLSYGASNIRSSAHAVQLSRGGELITIVWFLMAHFGLGDEYEINPGTQESELTTVETVRSLSI